MWSWPSWAYSNHHNNFFIISNFVQNYKSPQPSCTLAVLKNCTNFPEIINNSDEVLYYLTKKSFLRYSGKLVNSFTTVLLRLVDSEDHWRHKEDWFFLIETVILIKLLQVIAPCSSPQNHQKMRGFMIFSRGIKKKYSSELSLWKPRLQTKFS